MHLYTDAERVKQLRALEQALSAFIPVIAETEELRSSESAYRACMEEISRLLSCGFSQEDLSRLSRAVPRLFWLHKEWTPPLDRKSEGNYKEARWFADADRLHERVVQLASELRVMGRY